MIGKNNNSQKREINGFNSLFYRQYNKISSGFTK